MVKYCPKCGKIVDDDCYTCPYCNEYVPSVDADYISSATTIAGETFPVSSATAVSPSFTKIADEFGDNPDQIISTNQFLEKKIAQETLDYYVKIGYLTKLPGGKFKFTELGKQAYLQNKEFQEQINKNIEKIDLDKL